MEGSPDSTTSRGLSSYNEEQFGKVGADLLAAQYIGNLDYSRMLLLTNQTNLEGDYLRRAEFIPKFLSQPLKPMPWG